VDDLHLDLGVRETRQCVRQCLGRAALVRLDEKAQSPALAVGRLGHEILERGHALRRAAALRFTIQSLAALGDLA
jgi:hypothetical protein